MTATACTACGGTRLLPFYRVEAIPVHSCLLVDTREAALAFPKRDLELAFCEDCGFIFNRLFDPTVLDYSPDYEETQGFSPRFRRFLETLCDELAERHDLRGKTVLEIGCGKGEFLVALCERAGCRGIGIDPAYRPERTASPAMDRLTFIRDLYGTDYLHLAADADHVCCRHTLEHIPDVSGFLGLVRRGIGERRGVSLFFELPDMERILVEQAFWDIYYEHCNYFTAGSLASAFRRAGFRVTRQWKAYDGQYLMLEAEPAAASFGSSGDVARTREQVARFTAGIAARLAQLRGEAEAWRRAGKTVALWGSGSKAVGYLTTLGLEDEVAAVVDINPFKRGKHLAGTGHAIVGPDDLSGLRPDVVVVMNPIYVEEIAAELRRRGLAPEVTALT
ncbi:class I SAM-dependent methyltransferase [Benzoatithermus flavus]|uniref:Class I SAM-dependent methyltransferase n=1 Tax=Benzoatithermus flavus TaxID=3108223 RepID=A0ABU8XUA4_9PROT